MPLVGLTSVKLFVIEHSNPFSLPLRWYNLFNYLLLLDNLLVVSHAKLRRLQEEGNATSQEGNMTCLEFTCSLKGRLP